MIEDRDQLLSALCAELGRHTFVHTFRVCIDGPDAAGKTTLADDLAVQLRRHRPVVRLSIDRFHRPAKIRRQRGSLSPEGFYRDSFDHDVIVESILRPLGPGGDGRYLPGAFDYRTDAVILHALERAPDGAVLLFDGLFMLRAELRGFWDMSIYVHADPDVILERARVRDVEEFGSVEMVEERYRRRYLPGQELYRAEANPADAASIVLDMNNPMRPTVVRWIE